MKKGDILSKEVLNQFYSALLQEFRDSFKLFKNFNVQPLRFIK